MQTTLSPVAQLGTELANLTMNMTPDQRRTFYHAVHQASARWLARNENQRLDALVREVIQ